MQFFSKWIGPKKFDSNKYSINSSKDFGLEIDLEYPKELCVLQNDYPLGPYKIEIKEEMLPNYQLRIAHFYKIPVGSVKKIGA